MSGFNLHHISHSSSYHKGIGMFIACNQWCPITHWQIRLWDIWPNPASVQTRFTGSAFTSSWVVCCRLELVYVIMAYLWEIHGNASPDICFTKWPPCYVLITQHGFRCGQIGIQQENCHLKCKKKCLVNISLLLQESECKFSCNQEFSGN